MERARRPERRARARRSALQNAATRMLNSSLLLYLLAVLAYRTWIILNSDVVLLLKRAH